MRWLNSITDSEDMNLSKFQEMVKTEKPGMVQSIGSQGVGHDSATEQPELIQEWKPAHCASDIPVSQSVWASFSCSNKSPQTQQLKISEMYSLLLEVTGEKAVFLHAPASRGHLHVLTHSPFPLFQSPPCHVFKSPSDSDLCHYISFCNSWHYCFLHYRNPCDYTGSNRVI